MCRERGQNSRKWLKLVGVRRLIIPLYKRFAKVNTFFDAINFVIYMAHVTYIPYCKFGANSR